MVHHTIVGFVSKVCKCDQHFFPFFVPLVPNNGWRPLALSTQGSTHHTMTSTIALEESRRHSPVPGFFCRERFEHINAEDVAPSVIFSCNILPSPKHHDNLQVPVLEFVCRDPSCGALLPTEDAVVVEEDERVDPNFFDSGYTLAGRTGFKVWTGTRFMIETLLWPLPREKDFERLVYWQERIRKGLHILELGAGVGVVGSCLAAEGGHVLLTDLPTLVENSVAPNLGRIQSTFASVLSSSSTSTTLEEPTATWLGPPGVSIGRGWASTASLDWSESVANQISTKQSEQVDLIVASDCVFLVEMLQLLLSTAAALFEISASRRPSLILSFQRRDAQEGDNSQSFTTVNRVVREVKARNWSIDCLAWRPVVVGRETSEVFLFEITPPWKEFVAR